VRNDDESKADECAVKEKPSSVIETFESPALISLEESRTIGPSGSDCEIFELPSDEEAPSDVIIEPPREATHEESAMAGRSIAKATLMNLIVIRV
jgi:hypothetical protein